jgi:hypothetical protein
MVTEELPPDLDEVPPDLDDEPPTLAGASHFDEYTPHESIALAHDYVPQHDPYAPVLNTVEDDRPYQDLGGLARPDAYFGAIEFDCPEPPSGCGAKGKTLDSDGEKCKVWVERLGGWHVRKMPCLARIKLARQKGIL